MAAVRRRFEQHRDAQPPGVALGEATPRLVEPSDPRQPDAAGRHHDGSDRARDAGTAAEKRALAGDDAAAALARLDATIAFRRNKLGGQVVADIRRDSRR